jgi:hypothetical protein
MRQNVGLCVLIDWDLNAYTGRNLMKRHCMIHRQVLCSMILSMPEVVPAVTKLVNCITSNSLSQRHIRAFLKAGDSEYDDVLFYCDIRWLSRGKMLLTVYELRNDIMQFFIWMNVYFVVFFFCGVRTIHRRTVHRGIYFS